MRIIKRILPYIIGASILLAGVAYATVFNSNQVGTSPVNGYYLQTNGSTSTWMPVTGGSSTTIINGVSGPLFTITLSPTTTGVNAFTITTSSSNLFLNLLKYTSGTNINVDANGVINFVNPGFITTSTNNFGGLTNASITALSPIIWSTTSTISCPTCLTTSYVPKITIGGINSSTFQIGTGLNISATGTIGLSINPINASTTATSSWVLTSNGNSWVASSSAGGGGTPAGSSGQIQYNNNGSFGATSTIYVVSSTPEIVVGNNIGNYQNGIATSSYSNSTTTVLTTTGVTSTYASFIVPPSAFNITHTFIITAQGPQGGNTNYNGQTGGLGGIATGTYTNNVTGQTSLYYNIGAQAATQGYPGLSSPMTWIGTASSSLSTSTLLLIAPSGGAAGSLANGGNAGGLTGTAGSTTGSANGGGGGTQSAGGAAGTGGSSNGTAGGLFTGGNASGYGGAGGFGFYGGGGGGTTSSGIVGAGGGGGSVFLSSSLTSTSTASGAVTGNGKITITESVSYTYYINNTSTPIQSYGFSVQGHIFYGASTTPTITSCGTPSGINPSINGSDERGMVTVGTGSPTSCTIIFATPFDNPPSGWATLVGTAGYAYLSSDSTTTATFTFSSSPAKFVYGFDGY